MSRRLVVLFDDQCFAERWLRRWRGTRILALADEERCRSHRFHQLRLTLRLAALQQHAEALRRAGWRVEHRGLAADGEDGEDAARPWADHLKRRLEAHRSTVLAAFRPRDEARRRALAAIVEETGIELDLAPDPAFLLDHECVTGWVADQQRPAMHRFWPWYRRRSGLLMTADGEPVGGRWSFDSDNRERLPDAVAIPERPHLHHAEAVHRLRDLVAERFADHPGAGADFDLPTTRHQAERWLAHFLEHRLDDFGTYQDALSDRDPLLFHSLLSPLLNCGLITPDEVVRRTLNRHERDPVPLNALEGFLRQLAGWREFVRGVHEVHGPHQARSNHYAHQRRLGGCWWSGETGLPPVDAAIAKARDTGYLHHIERLMVMGNAFLLCEILPADVHRWFMEFSIDSDEWVMGPNVFGMALRSDGGLMTSKPYCCASNYLRRMGGWGSGDWCEILDGLYWRFVDRHREEFRANPRLATMVGTLDRMGSGRRHRILTKAGAFIARVTR